MALYADAKVERSEDGSADLAERLNKRIKKTAEAEGMEVAENSVNQEDERKLWDCGSDLQWATDDHSGLSIDVELVREARAEEVQFMERLPVWERSSWEECQPRTGRDPVSTKWVDIDKGRDGEVLSRLVARDFKSKNVAKDLDVFAATPPLMAPWQETRSVGL